MLFQGGRPGPLQDITRPTRTPHCRGGGSAADDNEDLISKPVPSNRKSNTFSKQLFSGLLKNQLSQKNFEETLDK